MATVGQNKGIYYGFRKANETARIFRFLLLYFGSTNVCFTFVNLSIIQELLPKKFVVKTVKDGKGKFGRILAVPFVDGENICEKLISEGHAREYHGGKKESWTPWKVQPTNYR